MYTATATLSADMRRHIARQNSGILIRLRGQLMHEGYLTTAQQQMLHLINRVLDERN